MQDWRKAIDQGNQHYLNRQWQAAERYYRLALDYADQHLAQWPDADEAVAALVVSHHNLADLYLATAASEQAARCLCRIHWQLLHTCQCRDYSSSLRQAAWRHSRHTYTELVHFLSLQGSHPQVEACLQQTHPGRFLATTELH